MNDEDRERLRPLAENLAAAYITWKMDLSGIDRVKKEYLAKGQVGELWYWLAERAIEGDVATFEQFILKSKP